MSRTPLVAILVATAFAVTGCATVQSDSGVSAAFHLQDHRTYRLLSPTIGESTRLASTVPPRLRQGLAAKGYAETADQPELIVSWKVLVDGELGAQLGQPQNAQHAALAMVSDADGSFGGRGSELGPPAEKTLIVFIQDAATHEVHWVGWAQTDVSDATLEERAAQSVEQVLKGLPVRRAS